MLIDQKSLTLYSYAIRDLKMVYVFVDESGDLGFTSSSSNYYVIACVEVFDLLELARATKRVRKTLRKKKKKHSRV